MIAFIQIILQVIPVIFAIPVLNKVFTIMVLQKTLQFYLLNEAANLVH